MTYTIKHSFISSGKKITGEENYEHKSLTDAQNGVHEILLGLVEFFVESGIKFTLRSDKDSFELEANGDVCAYSVAQEKAEE